MVVDADRRQIEQVLLNMFINAWQAMPDGGNLYLETSIADLDEAVCAPHQLEPGRYVKIAVTDTGIGMDEATRQQIFDPFFTTKEKRHGIGLGLASAYGIIKNHGGMIAVSSKVGHGSTFNIFLPVSENAPQGKIPVQKKPIRGSETVLLVDDEVKIIEVARPMLEYLGYQVISAQSGEQAVDVFRRKADEIDLVILDLIMPGMDGGKVFDRILEIKPAMRVILTSGYAVSGPAEEIMQRGCSGFIQKPYNISELSQIVRKILDEAKQH
jgi:two-component system cell cycle sensor histidine kinase/response regulator CckA